ncbi:MAG: hypothetical protein AAF206_01645 [Bacteroidota bacterium]
MNRIISCFCSINNQLLDFFPAISFKRTQITDLSQNVRVLGKNPFGMSKYRALLGIRIYKGKADELVCVICPTSDLRVLCVPESRCMINMTDTPAYREARRQIYFDDLFLN